MNAAEQRQFETLLDELLEGDLTVAEGERLQQALQDEQARRMMLEYLFLVGELHWNHAAEAHTNFQPPVGFPQPSRTETDSEGSFRTHASAAVFSRQLDAAARRRRVTLGAVVSVAALVLVAVGLFILGGVPRRPVAETPRPDGNGVVNPPAAAQIVAESGARWLDESGNSIPKPPLRTHAQVTLQEGIAELVTGPGDRLLVEGPARFRFEGKRSVRLESGEMVVDTDAVGPGFVVKTAGAVFHDLGTVFALRCNEQVSELHVISGAVEYVPSDESSASRTCTEGDAIRLQTDDRGRWTVSAIPFAPQEFAELPRRGSVAAFRRLVIGEASPEHYFDFELHTAPTARVADHRSKITLMPVLAAEGRLEQDLVPRQHGATRESRAVVLRRSAGGNHAGAGLQSEEAITLPEACTFEIIGRFDGVAPSATAALGTLVSLRSPEGTWLLWAVDARGRFVVKTPEEELICPVGQCSPGRWFYAALSLSSSPPSAEDENVPLQATLHVADLQAREIVPRTILADEPLRGFPWPQAARLGVGIGTDARGGHAYALQGAVDELAVYNRPLDEEAISIRLRVLVNPPHSGGTLTPLDDLLPDGWQSSGNTQTNE